MRKRVISLKNDDALLETTSQGLLNGEIKGFTKEKREVKTRVITGFSVFFLLIFTIILGHFYLSTLVFIIVITIFYEIVTLRRDYARELPAKMNILLNYYFFAVTVVLFFFRMLAKCVDFNENTLLISIAYYYPIVLFSAYMSGFCVWVATLRKEFLQYQMRLFFWTHMAILLGFIGSLSVYVIYEGFVWWLTGVIMVIINDCGAYFCGKIFGKRKLIGVSPNKTVEGFIGGLLCSLVINLIWNKVVLFDKIRFILCPQRSLTFLPFEQPICSLPNIFVQVPTSLPFLSNLFGPIQLSPFNIHSFFVALMAGTVAPFGGFFFSGVKRALKIKDFSAILPGHGGFLDRFDCQLVITSLVYVYLREIVYGGINSLTSVFYYIMHLPHEERRLLREKLKDNLSI